MTTKEQLITRISDRRRKAISVEEIMLLDDIVSWVQAREAKIAELQMRPEDAQPPGLPTDLHSAKYGFSF